MITYVRDLIEHPLVVGRTHGIQFMDRPNAASAVLFLDEFFRWQLRRVGNIWAWPPVSERDHGSHLYSPAVLVPIDSRGEIPDIAMSAMPALSEAFSISHCGRPMELQWSGIQTAYYQCPKCKGEFDVVAHEVVKP